MQEGDGTLLCFIVFHGRMGWARPAVNGDIEVALACFPINSPQLRQMLDIYMYEAKVIVLEDALTASRLSRSRRPAPIKAFTAKNPPNAIAVEVRQEVHDDEGQVIEREIRALPHGADHSSLLLRCLPT
jgi:hypothetical protein